MSLEKRHAAKQGSFLPRKSAFWRGWAVGGLCMPLPERAYPALYSGKLRSKCGCLRPKCARLRLFAAQLCCAPLFLRPKAIFARPDFANSLITPKGLCYTL
jgi:hypothetical protein